MGKYIEVTDEGFYLKGSFYRYDEIKEFKSRHDYYAKSGQFWTEFYEYEIILKDGKKLSDYLEDDIVYAPKLEYVRYRFLGYSLDKIECPKSNWNFVYIILLIDLVVILNIYYKIIMHWGVLLAVFLLSLITPRIVYGSMRMNKDASMCKDVLYVHKKVKEQGRW